MDKNDFLLALTIIAGYHTTKLTINPTPKPGGQVKIDNSIIIHECCASVINSLKAHGFSLCMHNNALHISHFG